LFQHLETHPNQNLTTSDFQEPAKLFRKLGTSLDLIVEILNNASAYEKEPDNSGTLHRAELQLEVILTNNVLWV
jgi:hypothetical protein